MLFAAANQSPAPEYFPMSTAQLHATNPFLPAKEPPRTKAHHYKRILCRNYMQLGFCRFQASCTFAHGENDRQRKPRPAPKPVAQVPPPTNCRQFHKEKFCIKGSQCTHRHEVRAYLRIHRHFYMPQMTAMTFLNRGTELNSRQRVVFHDIDTSAKLSVFSSIHALGDAEIQSQFESENVAPDQNGFAKPQVAWSMCEGETCSSLDTTDSSIEQEVAALLDNSSSEDSSESAHF